MNYYGRKRRYERLQFWMEDAYGEWITLSFSEVAPSDIERARLGKTEYPRSVFGVGVRQ